jgi:ketosteroid isomerase-like protein
MSKQDIIKHFFEAYADHDTAGMQACLADDISWDIPGQHPLAGVKHGIQEVVSFFETLGKAGFKAEPLFLEENDEYVVDVHRGWSTLGEGKVDTTWALVWHFGPDGKVHDVVNLCGNQAQMDTFCWANFSLKPLPHRLVE